MPDDYLHATEIYKRKGSKGIEKEKIEAWQNKWRERGPILFAEKYLTCPLDVPPHPLAKELQKEIDDCDCGVVHSKFRENGTPYHVILSDEQKFYLTDIWKNGVNLAVLAAARGAGKTFVFAIYNCWFISTTDRIEITCMGGSGKQSELVQKYIDDWRYDLPMLATIIHRSLQGIKRYCQTIGRSKCDFPACAPTSARGPHVKIVEIDEACEAEDKSEDGSKAVAAVQWQTIGKRDTKVLLASTAHYIHGMFYEYMTKPEFGFKVYRWCIARHISGELDPYKVYTDKEPTHWIPTVWWVTQKEIESKRRGKSDEEWLCEALGGASMASGAVFKKGDLDVVICNLCDKLGRECEPYKWGTCILVDFFKLGTEEDPIKFIIERISGYDHGPSNSPSALTIIGRKGEMVFALFNEEQLGIREEEKIDWIDSNCKRLKVWTFVPDPAASGTHINEKLEDMGYSVYSIAEQEKVARVYNLINFVEKHSLVIPKAFWYLTQSLRKTAWDTKREGKIRKVDDHSFDSLCYALVDFRPEDTSDSNFFDSLLKGKVNMPRIDDIYGKTK